MKKTKKSGRCLRLSEVRDVFVRWSTALAGFHFCSSNPLIDAVQLFCQMRPSYEMDRSPEDRRSDVYDQSPQKESTKQMNNQSFCFYLFIYLSFRLTTFHVSSRTFNDFDLFILSLFSVADTRL